LDLRNILAQASELVNKPISDRDFTKYFNKCLNDLSMLYDTAKSSETQNISCSDVDTIYPLLDNCLKIQKVENTDGCFISNFRIVNENSGSKIKFYWRGDYVVHQYIRHERITSMSGTTVLNDAYEQAVISFISAQVVKKTDKDAYNDLMSEFRENADLANKNLRGRTNSYKKIAVRPFR
jgi:hypothetical protein